jgi:hypothetical protein
MPQRVKQPMVSHRPSLCIEIYVVDRQEFEAEPETAPNGKLPRTEQFDRAGEEYQVVCPMTCSDNNDHYVHDGSL